jgi:hypothetical protein
MTKKRMALLAVLPLTIAVILGVPAMLPPDTRPGVTKANFDRIEMGMTLAEVEEIFGREGEPCPCPPWVIWEASGGSLVSIKFVDDCVLDKEWPDSKETILDKIRRWLHLN